MMISMIYLAIILASGTRKIKGIISEIHINKNPHVSLNLCSEEEIKT